MLSRQDALTVWMGSKRVFCLLVPCVRLARLPLSGCVVVVEESGAGDALFTPRLLMAGGVMMAALAAARGLVGVAVEEASRGGVDARMAAVLSCPARGTL